MLGGESDLAEFGQHSEREGSIDAHNGLAVRLSASQLDLVEAIEGVGGHEPDKRVVEVIVREGSLGDGVVLVVQRRRVPVNVDVNVGEVHLVRESARKAKVDVLALDWRVGVDSRGVLVEVENVQIGFARLKLDLLAGLRVVENGLGER